VVFHCANAGYGRWVKTLPPIMEGIIAGAAASGARLVYGDNLDMHGHVARPLTDLPERPVGPNATVRARVATRLMEAHANGAVRATIGRASNFYGPHARRSIVGQGLFPPALSGRPARGSLRVAPTVAISALAPFVALLRGVKEALDQSEQPWVVDHSKYAQAFGATPTPHPDAIGRTLKWFRERPVSR
jgi:hypothetical protein